MTKEAERTSYLMGDAEGTGLDGSERAVLNRVGAHLAGEAVWVQPAGDARSRLLAAATDETHRAPGSSADLEISHDDPSESSQATEPIDLSSRRRPGQRAKWFGGGLLSAAAVAAVVFVGVTTLTTDAEPPEKEVVAVYELAATPVDPDATGELDVVPTDAGVEFWLRITGLDNTTGGDYYSAWLVSGDDSVPVGSFHWRKGGVNIILWSGVDDPSYNRFMVTRQRVGDGGIRSDQVVLMGPVSALNGSVNNEPVDGQPVDE